MQAHDRAQGAVPARRIPLLRSTVAGTDVGRADWFPSSPRLMALDLPFLWSRVVCLGARSRGRALTLPHDRGEGGGVDRRHRQSRPQSAVKSRPWSKGTRRRA